jgi:CHAT domain-containing protein
MATTAEVLAGSADDELRAHGWRARMRAAWAALPPTEALAEGMQALDAIETLRYGQRDAADRARILDNWTSDYSWLAGRVLASGGDPAVAFEIFERLRGRVLLELIHSPGTVADPEALAAAQRRAVVLHRKLLDPALQETVRSQTLAALERVELEERMLRADSSTEAESEEPEPTTQQLISLERVQASLRPREAVLTFQVDHRIDLFGTPAGGSWVLVITTDAVRVLPLPDKQHLVAATSALRGLIARRDGTEVAIASELGHQLLGEVVAQLPPTIERLVLVPDGVLHHLPFAVLRPSTDGLPLGVRYELVVAPSATLWHAWRTALKSEQIAPEERVSALVLADPTFPHSRGSAEQRGGAWVDGLRLGRLPQARREGRAIRRHLGGELLLGAAASERRLKSEALSRYSVLHFATHAIADLRRPERSCLLLAPGDEEEDGLLRTSEIGDLKLQGNLVVLSACHTSHGEILRSEGLMSLARAFFTAGAGSVIGSHWPLADADAADFFDVFYRQLAVSKSAAAALKSTRRQGYEAGHLAQAWAGPTLLGSGDPRIVVQNRGRAPGLVTALLIGFMLLAFLATWMRHKSSTT